MAMLESRVEAALDTSYENSRRDIAVFKQGLSIKECDEKQRKKRSTKKFFYSESRKFLKGRCNR